MLYLGKKNVAITKSPKAMILELDVEKIDRLSQRKENENYRFRSFRGKPS